MGKFFEALKKSDGRRTNSKPEEGSGAELVDRLEKTSIVPDTDPVPNVRQLTELSPQPDGESTEQVTQITAHRERARQSPNPKPHFGISEDLVAFHNPQSFEAEQFRMLRTNILFPPEGKPSPRTILVTSALPGEGKSFVSSNLALTIAQNIDKHVLLIDCDMRRPSVHKIFGYKSVPGLSNYLRGEFALEDLIIKTANNHLSILPVGPVPLNPAELLSSNRMIALVSEVRARYDDRYIIIDSPPPHLTAESNALAQFVDGILLVVRFGKTNRDLVTQLVEKLEREKILGVVANSLRRDSAVFYGSGKYKKYGYSESRKA